MSMAPEVVALGLHKDHCVFLFRVLTLAWQASANVI